MSGGKITRTWRRRRVRDRQRQERAEQRSLESNRKIKFDSSIGDIVIHRGKHKGRKVSDLETKELVALWGSWNGLSDERRLIADAIKPYVQSKKKKSRRRIKRSVPSKPIPQQEKSNLEQNETHYQWTHPDGTKYWIPRYISMRGRENEECPFDAD